MKKLVARRLCVREISAPVVNLIYSKCQGNPFFSEEIAYALREQGLVIIDGDRCVPAPGLDLSAVKFPDSVQGLIIQRLDQLPAEVQTAAKVASVIGRSFPVALLRETYPIEEVRSRVEDYLRVLEEERLIQREAEDSYSFSHALVEEAVYERLLFAHRKSLHGVVAEALLRSHGHDPGPVAQLLGHHLSKAGRNHEAGHFLGMAGMRAVRHGAYRRAWLFWIGRSSCGLRARSGRRNACTRRAGAGCARNPSWAWAGWRKAVRAFGTRRKRWGFRRRREI